MKDYKNILVLENDLDAPYTVKTCLKKEIVPIEYWYNFNYSFYYNRDENMQKLVSMDKDTLIFAAPSFVGADNRFDNYLLLFLKLAEMNVKLDIGIYFYSGFFKYLLDFMYNESNLTKKINNHRMLKEVLDKHNIYEVTGNNIKNNNIHITYESLLEYYFESHRLIDTKVRIKETKEVKDLIYVNYHCNKPEEIELELGDKNATVYTSSTYNINEIEKI